jgi:hypothetical protein
VCAAHAHVGHPTSSPGCSDAASSLGVESSDIIVDVEMTRRIHTLACFFITAACIVGSAGAQGQPPPRGIVKIAGELYRAQNSMRSEPSFTLPGSGGSLFVFTFGPLFEGSSFGFARL